VFARIFEIDAEPLPSRPSPPSWSLHAGGLLWPELKTAREIKDSKARRRQSRRAFSVWRENSKTKGKKMGAQPQIDFDKMDGLVAGIVQDAGSGEVLMLGFLNPDSYAKTMETGFVTFWSRTRQKLWMKGETSGNRLRVVSAATDCDNDTLLFKVVVEGDGLVCHEGTVSCFTKSLAVANSAEVSRGQ
jgi:phosphoribosyl-AMP cyclohydrolase